MCRWATRFNRNVLFTCLGSPGKPVVDTVGPLLMQAGDRCSSAPTACGARSATPEITEQLVNLPLSDSVPELVEQALRKGGVKCDNVSVLAMEWEGIEGRQRQRPGHPDHRARRGRLRLDDPGQRARHRLRPNELDEAEIERSIKEINEAIKRSSQHKKA